MLSQAMRESAAGMKKVNPEAEKQPRAARAEEALLGTLMRHPDFIPKVAALLSPEQMVTSFNSALYRQILTRHENGLLVEPAFLAGEYGVEEVAYVTRMMQSAGERDGTLEDALTCAGVIKQEKERLSVGADASPEEIQAYLNKLKETRK